MSDSATIEPASPAGDASNDRAAALVAAGILLSRASGIVREVALSAWLGATTVAAEAFAFALGVPKILQNLLGEGALSASFIPVYSQVSDYDPRAARRLAGAVFGLLAALVAGLVVILMLAADPLVSVLARGAGESRSELIADLIRLMAPGIGFIVFAAWCLGILNAHRDFFLSFVAPVLWNAAIVVAVVVWTTQTDDLADLARAAAWGVFIGGVAQFVVQLPRVLRVAGPITPTLDMSLPATREVLRRFVPGVAGRGVVTLSTFVDLALSSFLAVGALAVLTKAQTIYALPVSVFAISIAAADLPELARASSDPNSSPSETVDRVRRSVDRVLFFLTFSVVAFVLGGRTIVGALFERGEFRSDDTIAVWAALAVFSLGLLATGMSRLLQNAAFAHGDVAGPARIALVRLSIAAIIGIILMWPADRFAVIDGAIEQVEQLEFGPLGGTIRELPNSHRLGAVGLTAGGAIAAWVEFGLLRRRLSGIADRIGAANALRVLAPAAVVAGVLIAVLAELLIDVPPLVAAPAVIALPAIVYIVISARRGSPTAAEIISRVRRASVAG